jgi:CheY-like chemotaxis protein
MARILIVDDEPDVRIYLKTVFEDQGHEVRAAENGREGTEILAAFTPDLVILDLIMPLQSGVHLYRTLRTDKDLKVIPVIILSAVVRHRDQYRDQFADLPEPDAWIDKPFKADRLLRVADSLLPSESAT